MTREDFGGQFDRLTEGHSFKASGKQYEAFYELLQHVEVDDFRVAVTRCLAQAKFPMVDQVLRECDRARETRRLAIAAAERLEAGETIAGKRRPGEGVSEIERAFNQQMMAAVIAGLGKGKDFNAAMEAGLVEVIGNDPAIAGWAAKEPMGACGFHAGDHSVMDCVMDELVFWGFLKGGLDRVAAFRALKPVARAPLREDVLLYLDSYGRTLADQRGPAKVSCEA